MNIYLIAPLPDFGSASLVSEQTQQLGERYTSMAAAGIATVAAYFVEGFQLRLCDEAIEDVDFDDPSDIICISMNVAQAARGLEIARRFKAMNRTIIMGGPHVSLAPEVFEGEADCLVVGEFEPVADTLIRDLREQRLQIRYQGGKADLSQTRMPRWDLYRNDRAIVGVIQTSRGCPFECTFCDVIQYLGRTQRHKPLEAVLAEAQTLYDLGYRQINLSDDNFTVYRRRTRALLEALAQWNGREDRDPVQFATQASIDLSRDQGLMDQCNEAGLRDIFFGIETSNEAALKESKKRQNLRQDLVEQTQRIVRSGIVAKAGMIVGFDSDDLGCFERQLQFGMALPAVDIKVSVLVASIATPLHAQMRAAGRLVSDGPETKFPGSGLWTNIEPLNMTRKQLADGAQWLVQTLYDPDNVIRRFQHLAALLKPAPIHLRRAPDRTTSGAGSAGILKVMRVSARQPAGRRVIEAVSELARQYPQISRDLSAALGAYLNAQGHRHHST